MASGSFVYASMYFFVQEFWKPGGGGFALDGLRTPWHGPRVERLWRLWTLIDHLRHVI